MTRPARLLIGITAFLVGVPLIAIAGIAVWVYCALPENLDPPSPVLPSEALRVFWVEFGGTPDLDPRLPEKYRFPWQPPEAENDRASSILVQQAAKYLMLRNSRRRSHVRNMLAEISAGIIIIRQWSPADALSEFAYGSYYGHGHEGIEDAAVGYFGRGVAELSTKELAMLAALTKSPSSLSPWCKPDRLEERMARLREALDFSIGLPAVLPAPPSACAKSGVG
jgi:hypothetical protein